MDVFYSYRILTLRRMCYTLVWILGILVHIMAQEEAQISNSKYKQWADTLGVRLRLISEDFSGARAVEKRYEDAKNDVSIKEVDGKELLETFRSQIELMFQNKVIAVENIVAAAEAEFYNFKATNITTYYNALLIESTKEEAERKRNRSTATDGLKELFVTFELNEDIHFLDIPVNLTHSTVQVATSAYNLGRDLLDDIEATEPLNKVFSDNYKNDPTLTWQYFGSEEGFFRNYPGVKWEPNEDGLDLFDCRKRGWYIQAATSPKDIVILFDKSGSQKGYTINIGKYLLEIILDTLSPNDFVNIMMFNESTHYLEPCFNDTLVQATNVNKNVFVNKSQEIIPGGEADVCAAFEKAFILLREFEEEGGGSRCNQAIMMITDGSEVTCDSVFEDMNQDKQIRIFTYLLGRTIGAHENLAKIACGNSGFFSKINANSDVPEKVTDYIHVLGRPLVNQGKHDTYWSNIYLDAQTLHLVTTISQPVLDTKNETKSAGILHGVAGVDVPIFLILEYMPAFKLGAWGYSFMTTNNGYILFHPLHEPYHMEGLNPHYNSIDVTEVELSYDSEELRTNMVNRTTGSTKMEVDTPYDDKKRVAKMMNDYYYTKITDTPFSLAIILNGDDGKHQLIVPQVFNFSNSGGSGWWSSTPCKIHKGLEHLFSISFENNTRLADWDYCKLTTEEAKQYSLEVIISHYLANAAKEDGNISTTCNGELLNHLFFDAAVTQPMLLYWKDAFVHDKYFPAHNNMSAELLDPLMQTKSECGNTDPNTIAEGEISNFTGHRTNGSFSTYTLLEAIVMSFIGTKSGLNRAFYNWRLSGSKFIEDHKNTLEEDYYKRAMMDATNEEFVFSVPLKKTSGYSVGLHNKSLVTVSSPVKLTKDGKVTTVAVAGYQMYLSALIDAMVVVSKDTCAEGDFCCGNDNTDCFLVDNHAYIVASKDISEIGAHFSSLQQNQDLFATLVSDWVFQDIKIVDYQAMCAKKKDKYSAANILRNPFGTVFSFLSGFVHQLVISLMSTSLYDISTLLFFPFDEISAYVYVEEIEYEPCDMENTYYLLDKTALPRYGHVGGENCTDDCQKFFAVNQVPGTNLIWVVIDKDCECNAHFEFGLDPVRVEYNATERCERLTQDRLRIRPSSCSVFDKDVEDSEECGGGHMLKSSWTLPLLLFIVSHICKLYRCMDSL